MHVIVYSLIIHINYILHKIHVNCYNMLRPLTYKFVDGSEGKITGVEKQTAKSTQFRLLLEELGRAGIYPENEC